jgi:hypothetical protein
MDATQQQLAKSLELALELIRHQNHNINALQASLFALRESVASGRPPLPFDAALRQVNQEQRESRYSPDDILPLLNEHLEKVRSLK